MTPGQNGDVTVAMKRDVEETRTKAVVVFEITGSSEAINALDRDRIQDLINTTMAAFASNFPGKPDAPTEATDPQEHPPNDAAAVSATVRKENFTVANNGSNGKGEANSSASPR